MEELKRKLFKTTLNDYPESHNTSFFIAEKPFHPEVQINYPYILKTITITVCVRGEGKIKINLKEHSIERDTLLVILPGRVTEFIEKSDDMLLSSVFFIPEYLVGLTPTIDINLFTKIDQKPCLKITPEESSGVLNFYSFIVKQYKKVKQLYREEIAKNLLHVLMMEVTYIYHNFKEKIESSTVRGESLFTRFLQLLVRYHGKERSVAFYADQMSLTPKYLSKIIKENSRKSPLEWINEMVILSAKGLLKTSDLTVLQISEELNFPNPSFFGNFFKKHTGMTPVQYRKI